jgi:cyclopropane-fatty-acyl-phospholipid synthase
MLDPRMVYSCGYWEDADTLAEAQEAKLDLVCRKLGLEEGMRVLDIGCGWGSFAELAAERYGVEVVGLTISEEQARRARERCADLDVEIRLEDYRELEEGGAFDRVVSIGMFEHVGVKNYRTFMEVAHRALVDDGLQMLHTIGSPTANETADPWIEKYIFPNSMLPALQQIAEAAEGLFVVEDLHNFGQYYDPTLMAWHENVEAAWQDPPDRYDERFRRMWRYYLLSSAGSFRARAIQLWQIVLAKDRGVEGGYEPVR